MFDIVINLFSIFIDCLPYLIVLYIIFDFVGNLLFGRR